MRSAKACMVLALRRSASRPEAREPSRPGQGNRQGGSSSNGNRQGSSSNNNRQGGSFNGNGKRNNKRPPFNNNNNAPYKRQNTQANAAQIAQQTQKQLDTKGSYQGNNWDEAYRWKITNIQIFEKKRRVWKPLSIMLT